MRNVGEALQIVAYLGNIHNRSLCSLQCVCFDQLKCDSYFCYLSETLILSSKEFYLKYITDQEAVKLMMNSFASVRRGK